MYRGCRFGAGLANWKVGKMLLEQGNEFISRMRFVEELGTPRTDEIFHPCRCSWVERTTTVEDHRYIIFEAYEFFHHFGSVHHRHYQIRDDEIDARILGENFKTFPSVLRFEDLQAIRDDLSQEPSHHVSDERFILHDEDGDAVFLFHYEILSSLYY